MTTHLLHIILSSVSHSRSIVANGKSSDMVSFMCRRHACALTYTPESECNDFSRSKFFADAAPQ